MNAESDLSSWSRSLEDVAWDRWGRSFRPRLQSLAFAPKLVREPRAYDKIPAIMLVASSATALLHSPLFEAVELLEKASGAFKVVVFTDCPASSGIRDYDWAVEHCMAEADWQATSTSNWLEMAGKRLFWTSKIYKPALILAGRDAASAISEIRRLGTAFSIDNALLKGALDHLRAGLESLPNGEHPMLRGWIGETTVGDESTHRLNPPEYLHAELRIVRGRGRITLITDDSEAAGNLSQAAADHDWSVVNVSGLNQIDDLARRRLLRAVSSAFQDTLTFSVSNKPGASKDFHVNGGRVEIDNSTSTYSLEMKHTARRTGNELGWLVNNLVKISTADEVVEALL